ncbi:MAG: hypothetical protein EHM42_10725 [Planctomycetaceae bacterium]|nr:MAG: hypothetical protein EHM42_10725 [Planctomycetaceae bacterium]
MPFVMFLRVWAQYRATPGAKEMWIPGLKNVIRSSAGDLAGLVADGLFPLTPAEVFEVLSEQPPASRTRRDVIELARIASEAGQLDDAVSNVQQALAAGPAAKTPLAENRRLLEVLLRLRRTVEAVELAETLSQSPGRTPEELLDLAELLQPFHQQELTAKLAVRALSDSTATGSRRVRLLVRRSALLPDDEARRVLLEAARQAEHDSRLRRDVVSHLLASFAPNAMDLETASQLAQATDDDDLAAELWLRVADLASQMAQSEAAAEAAWKGYRLAPDRVDSPEWLCRILSTARQHDRLIQVLEAKLRSGNVLSQELIDLLDEAYTSVGRPVDAIRAATNALAPKPTRQAPRR